jgi:hypothetical protein
MKIKIRKNQFGGILTATATVHDAETDEEFQCELPTIRIAFAYLVLSRPPKGTERIKLSSGQFAGWGSIQALYTPPSKKFPRGRAIKVDDIPKICIRYETNDGDDIYLAPEGYRWAPYIPYKRSAVEKEQLKLRYKEAAY